MIKTVTHDRLTNWGRYWRDGHTPLGRCRSIEHRYVPEKSEYEAEDRGDRDVRKALKPDQRDAEIVMEAWKKCRPKTKKLLQLVYAWSKWNEKSGKEITVQKICHRCGIMQDPPAYRAYEVALFRAQKEIENLLASGFLEIVPRASSSTMLSQSKSVLEEPCEELV